MSIFKQSFDKEVQEQLDKRKEAFKTRSPKDLTYITSRNAWVRLTSGVNTINDAEGTISYDDRLARKYILQGGTLNPDGSLKSGIGSSFSNAYSNENYRLGLRPMPGITDINIKSRSAYGSLRDATINFNCWDIVQLEELEPLFMRPGYLALLEWGWSPYLKKDNNLEYLKTKSKFDIFNPSGTLLEINTQLYSASLQSQGNYDSMLGKIKNYSWKFRPDGGYDCSVTLTSYGEVIESLKVNYTPSTYYFPTGSLTNGLLYQATDLGEEGSRVIGNYYQKNILAGTIFELYSYAKNYAAKNPSRNIKDGFSLTSYSGTVKKDLNFFIKQIETSKDSAETQTTDSFLTDSVKVWVTLDSFLNILNKTVLPRATANKTEFPIVEITTKDNEGQDLLCVAHPLQVSVDPTVCLIDSEVWRNLRVSSDLEQQIKIKSQADVENMIAKCPYNVADNFKAPAAETLFRATNATSPEVTAREIDQYLNNNKGNIDSAVKALIYTFDLYLTVKSETTVTGTAGQSISTDAYYFNNKKITGKINLNSFLADEFDINLLFLVKKYTKNAITLDLLKISHDYITKAKQKAAIDSNKTITDARTSVDKAQVGLKFLSSLDKKYFLPNDSQKHGVIGNIYVNLGYLYSLSVNKGLESQDKKEKDEIALFDYIKSVMKGIQSSIGNVNNFEPHVRNDSILEIIDINFATPPGKSAQELFGEIYEIPVQGLESLVRNISFESQIFPEQSAMISIAASTRPSSLGTDTSTLTAYNRGIQNRIIPEIAPPYPEDSNNLATLNYNIGLNLGKLTPYFAGLESYFIDGFWFFDKEKISSFDVAKSSDYKNTLKDLIATTKNFFNDPNKFSAIIPTKLSFTIDGIGGIIIGNLFKVPASFLPSGYKGNKKIGRQLGYIVTNLGHSIQNGDWTTEVTAQTIILENAIAEGAEFDYNKILVPLPDGGTAIGALGPVNSGTPSTTKVPSDLKPLGNGKITEDKLKTISTQPTYKLYPPAADAFIRMEADAKKAGFTLPLTSAYRTLARQEEVYKDYNGVGVAPAGSSPHGWGIAIDITPSHFGGVKRTTSPRVNEVQRQTPLYKWLEANASKYNFFNPPALQDGQGYDEWWHWEWWG